MKGRFSWWLGLVVLSVVLLGLDYLTSPYILFPVTLVIPVCIAAWQLGWKSGIGFAIVLSFFRFAIVHLGTEADFYFFIDLVNTLIYFVLLSALAFLFDQIIRQRREMITRLRGYADAVASFKEQESQKGEQFQRAVMDNMGEGLYSVDSQGLVTYVNPIAEGLLGYSAAEMLGRRMHDLTHHHYPDGRRFPIEECAGTRVLHHGEALREFDDTFIRKDGTFFPVRVSSSPLRFGGKPVGLVVVFRDMTEEQKAMEEIRQATAQLHELNSTLEKRVAERTAATQEQEERFRSAFDFAPIGMALVAVDGHWLRVNRALRDIVGYPESELLATDFQSITHPDDLQEDLSYNRQLLDGTIPTYQMEKRYFHKDGRIVHILLAGSIVRDAKGKNLYCIKQIQDITARKNSEEILFRSLREKEVLLREIHHRVKNNLAVISSLLFLQSTQTGDAEIVRVLQDCQNRIRSMALVHERLYHSHDLADMNFADYVQDLAQQLFRTYVIVPHLIVLNTNLAKISLNINRAIPVGLILNELISNALKHAFPNGRPGEVLVASAVTDAGDLLFSVSDSGVGLPDDATWRNPSSLGLRLVTSLTQQLNARFEFVRLQPGTEARLILTSSDDSIRS